MKPYITPFLLILPHQKVNQRDLSLHENPLPKLRRKRTYAVSWTFSRSWPRWLFTNCAISMNQLSAGSPVYNTNVLRCTSIMYYTWSVYSVYWGIYHRTMKQCSRKRLLFCNCCLYHRYPHRIDLFSSYLGLTWKGRYVVYYSSYHETIRISLHVFKVDRFVTRFRTGLPTLIFFPIYIGNESCWVRMYWLLVLRSNTWGWGGCLPPT